MKVYNPEKFEEFLLKSWSYFIEKPKLIAFVLKSIRDHADLNKVEGEPPVKGMQFTISRFYPGDGFFNVSVEFSCPAADGMAMGTCEALLKWNGEMDHIRTVGVLFSS